MIVVPGNTPQAREVLVTYLARKIGVTPYDMVGAVPYEVIGVVNSQDKLMGAILYLNRRAHTIEMSWAGEPGWLSKGVVHTMLSYPFEQLGCLTITGTVKVTNVKSQRLAEKLGFRPIGIVPHAYGKGEHGYLYCLSFDECKWLERLGGRHERQRAEAA